MVTKTLLFSKRYIHSTFSIQSLNPKKRQHRHRQPVLLASQRGFTTTNESNDGVRTTTTTTTSLLEPVPVNGHRIVLMRHGESAFNNGNIFTGWCDVAVTPRGIVEAVEAGEVFRSHHIIFRNCYVSLLTRSIITAQRSLEAAGCSFVPLRFDWRLNERHYGALQGLSKDRIADQLGTTRVMGWRRSYTKRPPAMTSQHPHYTIINEDIRYQHVKDQIPVTESLRDCQYRVIEAWKDITQQIQEQYRTDNDTCTNVNSNNYLSSAPYTLLVAHANSLRALIMHLDNINEHDIENLNIPTAIPFYYDIDVTTGEIINPTKHNNNNNDVDDNNTDTRRNRVDQLFRGVYIADERKKRCFLERRRAANDPWLWALADHQVSRSMLLNDDSKVGTATDVEEEFATTVATEDVNGFLEDGINQEAARLSELFGTHQP